MRFIIQLYLPSKKVEFSGNQMTWSGGDVIASYVKNSTIDYIYTLMNLNFHSELLVIVDDMESYTIYKVLFVQSAIVTSLLKILPTVYRK